MKHNEHKRHKHGELPGQVSRKVIIQMREKLEPISLRFGEISLKNIKELRSYMKQKSKKRQRVRDIKTIKEDLL